MGVLIVEFLAIAVWCVVLVNRFGQTWDFATQYQAIYLIAHGHLNAASTTLGHPMWRDHGSFITYAIAAIFRIWEHPVLLLWIQAVAIVAAQWVAFELVCEIAARDAVKSRNASLATVLAGTGGALLIFNPWVLWTVSFDVHFEAVLAPFFIIMMVRDTLVGRRRAWVWVPFALLCGDAASAFVLAVGASLCVAGRRWWKQGLGIMVAAALWSVCLVAMHATVGSSPAIYATVTGVSNSARDQSGGAVKVAEAILEHPIRALDALWANALNIWANVSPPGVLGLLWPPLAIPALVAVAEGALPAGAQFSAPGFQNCLLIFAVAIGSVGILAWMTTLRAFSKRSRTIVVLALLLGINAIVWYAVWIPKVASRWIAVSSSAAHELSTIQSQIKPDDEVIASQGVVGQFADRKSVYAVFDANDTVPVTSDTVWVILAPRQGIESSSSSGIEADIGRLANTPGVRMISGHGIWAFELHPADQTSDIHLDGLKSGQSIPAWTVEGKAADAVNVGPVADWYAGSTATSGYVMSHAYWQLQPGTYRATVSIAVTTTASVEVWDNSAHQLLSRQTVPSTGGKTNVTADFTVGKAGASDLFDGWGIWRMRVLGPSGDQIEVRVWTPSGNQSISVYSVGVQRIGS